MAVAVGEVVAAVSAQLGPVQSLVGHGLGGLTALLCAARGLELRAPLEPGAGTGAALAAIRAAGVPGPGPDRHLAPELEAMERLVASGELIGAVEDAIGELR